MKMRFVLKWYIERISLWMTELPPLSLLIIHYSNWALLPL